MVTCSRLLSEVSNLLDGDVDGDLRRELELHLEACRACLALYRSLRLTLRVSHTADPYQMPEGAGLRLSGLIHHRLVAFRPGRVSHGFRR